MGNPLTRPDQAFTLPELAPDLLRRVPATRTHLLIRPPAPSWGIGLSPQLDPFTGIQSITIKLYGAAASICRVTVPVGAEPALPQDPFPVPRSQGAGPGRTMMIVGAAGLDEALGQWCVRWLGSAVSVVVFEAGSLSAVVGIRLADDREVVVKARRSVPRLQAAYAVHRHVWQCGYPAPEPLVPPTPLDAAESASAERLVRGGEIGGRSPGDAARSAEALAALIEITASAGDVGSLSPSPSWVAWDHDGPGLWPGTDAGPGSLNLVAGPGWLDEAGARCRGRLRRYRAPRVIGHADWHADNVRWSGGRLLVVHDWDSVVSQPEAVIAGIAAAIFPASGDVWQPATIEESEQFMFAYIGASTRAWTPDDTEAFWAASAWTLAVDAKEAVAGGSVPDLTEAETFRRLSLAGA